MLEVVERQSQALTERPQQPIVDYETLPQRLPPAPKRKRGGILLSFILLVIVPTILGGIYYGFIASDQYVTEVRFAVRGADRFGNPQSGGMSAAIPGGNSTGSDGQVVAEFLESRQIVENLESKIHLSRIFSHPGADLLSRFDPSEPIEYLVKHWRAVTDVDFDSLSGLITFSVRAYTPEDSRTIAAAVISESEQVVNDMTRRVREDAVAQSEREVQEAELRLKLVRAAIKNFRDREQSVDPAKAAESQLGILHELQGELARREAERTTLLSYMDENAPQVVFANNQIEALRKQIAAEQARLGNTDSTANPLSSQLRTFADLQVEQEFAEKAYASALAALEESRAEAARQHRYLTTFVHPSLAQYPLYPKRVLFTGIVFAVAFVSWAILLLAFYAIRDHMR